MLLVVNVPAAWSLSMQRNVPCRILLVQIIGFVKTASAFSVRGVSILTMYASATSVTIQQLVKKGLFATDVKKSVTLTPVLRIYVLRRS